MDKWAMPANTGSDKEFPDAKKLRAELVEKLKGRSCCGGLDLSATVDLTAFGLVFGPREEVTGPDPEDKTKKQIVVRCRSELLRTPVLLASCFYCRATIPS